MTDSMIPAANDNELDLSAVEEWLPLQDDQRATASDAETVLDELFASFGAL